MGADRAFEPTRVGPLTLRNRIIRTAAFEGMSQKGAPTPELCEHHRRVAAGGAAMTTVAYCSVSTDGRTYDHQLLMRESIVAELRHLTDLVHAEDAAAAIQLGHSGYFADRAAIGTRAIGPSRMFNTYGLSLCRAMTNEDIERVTGEFVTAARLAREAGFDAVELHAGHGYLLSQFLSPYTNRRKDEWGGSTAARQRFPLQVLSRVLDAVGSDVAVLVKTNMRDGFSGGLELDEAIDAARAFERAGAAGLVLSGGFVSKTPFYMLRGNLPVREMVSVQKSALRKIGLTLFGRALVQSYPFEELFFLDDARAVRREVSLPLVLVGGVCSSAGIARAMEEGFDLVAMGRALIMDPDFVHKLKREQATESPCDQCNHCIAEMDRGGVRCPYADADGNRVSSPA